MYWHFLIKLEVHLKDGSCIFGLYYSVETTTTIVVLMSFTLERFISWYANFISYSII